MKMSRLLPVLMSSALAAVSAQAASVSPTAITPGSTLITVLEDDGNALNNQTWLTFTAVAGTQIRLFVDSVNDTFDPCQELYFGDVSGLDFGSANGNCIARNGQSLLSFVADNDDSGGTLSSLIEITAPQTGTYSLVVTDLFTNNAQLTLQSRFTPQANAVPLPGTLALAGLALALMARTRRRA